MEYRGIEYHHKMWATWDKQIASAFVCSDEKLLQHVSTTLFEERTREELHTMIDYYLDNVDKCKELKKANDLAAGVFYETLNYKGD